MVDGAHGLTGRHVLKYVLHCHHVLKFVVIRESENAFVTILHPQEVEKIVLVTIANNKRVMLQILQVRK